MGGGRPGLGRDGQAVAGREAVGHQPAVDHVPAGLPDQVVLEEVGVLVQEGLHLGQVGARTREVEL